MSTKKDEALEILKAEECPVCDAWKRRGYAFCYACYGKLPQAMKRKVYSPLGGGFEEAFDVAFEYLSDE